MGELTVKAQYESKTSNAIQSVLHVTFPIWGLASPIAFSVAVVAFFTMLWNRSIELVINEQSIAGIGLILSFLMIPLIALFTIKRLKNNNLILDKNGIQLPFEFDKLLRRRSYYSWSEIVKIQALPSDKQDWQQKKLVLYLKSGKPLSIGLSHYKASDVEQMLVSFETWANQAEKDLTIESLHQSIKATSSQTMHGLSYTDMWEDELRRRFSPAAFMALEPGRVLRNGSLKVVRQLAIGGLSAIYLCQLSDQALVVLKEAVVPEGSSESVRGKAQELFEREAALLAKLSHPSIVKVMDSFVEGGRSYMLLEYVAGQDLRQFIRQNGPQRESTVIDWAIQIANIMKHLHEQDPPIIHRDLTPDNLVLREDGSIVLIDFGAANEFISKATGTFVGKQSFIAPEQFRGKAVIQSDIYAFGCTLFFLLTGNEPEALSSSSPKEVNSAISSELNEVVESCTQMEARDRFQSASQLIPVLRRIAASAFGVV